MVSKSSVAASVIALAIGVGSAGPASAHGYHHGFYAWGPLGLLGALVEGAAVVATAPLVALTHPPVYYAPPPAYYAPAPAYYAPPAPVYYGYPRYYGAPAYYYRHP